MTVAPPREWSRLQKFVWTMRQHGNTPANLNMATLAKHNDWTSEGELRVEFHLQECDKLPEETAVTVPPAITQSEEEE